MPLVTLKCREKWYPTHAGGLVYDLGEALPVLLTGDGHELLLDEGTPPDAVQVDFQKFDELSINIPDLWILIQFTEGGVRANDLALKEVRNHIVERIARWMRARMADRYSRGAGFGDDPVIALDIFWGPGHGCMMGRDTTVTLSW